MELAISRNLRGNADSFYHIGLVSRRREPLALGCCPSIVPPQSAMEGGVARNEVTRIVQNVLTTRRS
jgi:hypothetical protein